MPDLTSQIAQLQSLLDAGVLTRSEVDVERQPLADTALGRTPTPAVVDPLSLDLQGDTMALLNRGLQLPAVLPQVHTRIPIIAEA